MNLNAAMASHTSPAGGLSPTAWRGKGDEQRAGLEQAQRSDEEGPGR